jgi:hypothetical protein
MLDCDFSWNFLILCSSDKKVNQGHFNWERTVITLKHKVDGLW